MDPNQNKKNQSYKATLQSLSSNRTSGVSKNAESSNIIKVKTQAQLREALAYEKLSGFEAGIYSVECNDVTYLSCLGASEDSGYIVFSSSYEPTTDEKIYYKDFDKLPIGKRLPVHKLRHGWKLHISADPSEKNLSNAWQSILPVLLKHHYGGKIMVPEGKRFTSSKQKAMIFQEGKTIVIYTYMNPELNLQTFCNDLHNALASNEVKPAGLPDINKIIPGTNYLSYRCDLDKCSGNFTERYGSYLSADRAFEIAEANITDPANPYGRPNPLEGVKCGLAAATEESKQAIEDAPLEDDPPPSFSI